MNAPSKHRFARCARRSPRFFGAAPRDFADRFSTLRQARLERRIGLVGGPKKCAAQRADVRRKLLALRVNRERPARARWRQSQRSAQRGATPEAAQRAPPFARAAGVI
ncbi:MAG: hypothetical protein V4484_08795 [Pseudomonadota bacterium]